MKNTIFSITLILLCSLLLYQAKTDAGTYDEVAHITAGYTYLYKKDFRLYPDNPPLIKMISVLPWIPLKDSLHFPENSENWTKPQKIDQWALGTQFLYISGNDADTLIFAARLPIIIITISLGILVYIISAHFYGRRAGLFALFLYTLSPDIRAHGHLATTDTGATFFALLGAFLLYLAYKKEKLYLTILAGSMFSLAILSKYSMILIVLSTLLLASIYTIKRHSLQNILKIAITIVVIYGLLWIISISIGYQKKTFPYERVPLNQSASKELKEKTGWKLIQAIPLPHYYKIGIETMYARNIITQPTYLFGLVVPQGGLKIFFPLSYILKTPIPILILLVGSVIQLTLKKDWHKLLPFILGSMFFIEIMTIGNLSIGTRFFYPATVLFIITAASFIKTTRIHKMIIATLGAWLIMTNTLAFPYDISFINEIGGGTKNGYNALVDSSYDWGQDLKRLASWYEKNGKGKEMKISYLGTADPSYYGIKYKRLTFEDLQNPNGLVAVSVTNLKLGGVYTKDQKGNTIYQDNVIEKLLNKTPKDRVGTTIFIYEF